MHTKYWYKSDSDRKRIKGGAACARCNSPLRPHLQTGLQWRGELEGNEESFCPSCDKRDKYLLLQARGCIRMFGGMLGIHEMLDLYEDREKAGRLYHDPFEKAREMYRGRDTLSVSDIERWIQRGLIDKTKDERLSLSAQNAREEIKKYQKAQSVMREIHTDAEGKRPESEDKGLPVRIREDGGASTGKHRWMAMKAVS